MQQAALPFTQKLPQRTGPQKVKASEAMTGTKVEKTERFFGLWLFPTTLLPEYFRLNPVYNRAYELFMVQSQRPEIIQQNTHVQKHLHHTQEELTTFQVPNSTCKCPHQRAFEITWFKKLPVPAWSL